MNSRAITMRTASTPAHPKPAKISFLWIEPCTAASPPKARGNLSEGQDNRNLIAAGLPRTLRAIRPHLEGKVLPLRGGEAEFEKEGGLAREGEDFGQPVRPGLEHEGLDQRATEPRPLPVGPHRKPGHLAQPLRIDLERPAGDDLARGRLRHHVLFDVTAQIVIRAWQEVPGRDERSHERLELRDVREDRPPHDDTREKGDGRGTLRSVDGYGAHANTASRIATPRSSSGSVITSGGMIRITSGPAVSTSRPRSRAAVTNGAAGSDSSRPHRSPRPRTALTRRAAPASRPSRAPNQSPLRRTSARNSGSARVRSTSSATPATSGPPPNVVAWSPGLSAAATALVTSTAPIGSPPASGFASVRMSGMTPVCS